MRKMTAVDSLYGSCCGGSKGRSINTLAEGTRKTALAVTLVALAN